MSALAAVEKDMCDGLSSRSAVAAGTGDVWHSSGEEEVVEPDLLGPQLHQQRALPLSEPLVEPEYFLGGRWSVSVGCCHGADLDSLLERAKLLSEQLRDR